MATKASGTLVLIIDKKHAQWGHMVTTPPALELRFWCRLRMASTQPHVGASWAPPAHEPEWLSVSV